MPRKAQRRSQPLVGNTDNVVFGRATVLDNGMIGEKPSGRVTLERSDTVPAPAQAENDLYALNSLQLHRGRPLEQLTLQIPLEYLVDNLPPGARSQVGIPVGGTPYIFNCPDADVLRRIQKHYRRWPGFWDTFRDSEYVFWPIEVEGGYFVTAIFHMRKGMMDDPTFDAHGDPNVDIPQVPHPHFNYVEAWSVVDPQRGEASQARVTRVKDRIERTFEVEGITFGHLAYQEQYFPEREWRAMPWVPPPSDGDDWSSGIRSFALVRQLIQRVVDSYCNQVGYEPNFFIEPTSGWLDVDQVRHEMMGICAINALEDMNWNARLAVECIEEISTLASINPFRAALLAPDNADKHAYIPGTDRDGVPRRAP
ncbi:hypothetical protein CIB48_g4850 [Xylaria polymorpha]|nr:hypothetical protein CIB48_g4850 [Xylaria polymorpha]